MRNETGHETETIYGEAERERKKKKICAAFTVELTPPPSPLSLHPLAKKRMQSYELYQTMEYLQALP